MPFVTDTFTDTSNTAIQSHVGELGATWTLGTANQDDSAISDANRWRPGGTTGQMAAYASGVPAGAEYDVSADFRVFTTGSTGQAPGIAGRISTSADTQYQARYNEFNGDWELNKWVAGDETLLGSYTQTLTPGVTYVVRLEIRNATKKVFIDGVERISSADNDITAAGRAGLRGFSNAEPGNAGGIHLDNFDASDPGGPPPTAVNSISWTGFV